MAFKIILSVKMVEEGVSGFIFDTIDEGVQAVQKARKLERDSFRAMMRRKRRLHASRAML